MLVKKKLITSKFKPLNGTDTIQTVKERMDQEGVQTLPVIDSTTHTLIGEVSYHALETAESGNSVSDIDLQDPIKLYWGQHVFEAARLMLQYERKLLPVVDEDWKLLGVIEKDEVLNVLPRMLNITEPGSVITVVLDRMDFSITEIVNIMEREGAKILGLTVEKSEESAQTIELSFKIDLQDVSRVAAALRRYDYVISTNSENEIFNQDLETRADELLKFIDM
ncbi:CBS domain-containing protein [Fodinibius sediminis]|uniref:CBS domain-containing protein n=1 Tax=Fodinibius sediminis TaxID=1214077 RepID=A0A521BV78_9BACT|nr:CBS domain-containing protein [Fodinibius sediminis]SMO50985.1 CBS domain-containing protein [Fodinibius sediminis]